MALQPDYKDILEEFARHAVEYLVVGGYAVAVHATPRFTKDLDLWIGPTRANLERARRALTAFGAPAALLDQLDEATLDDVLWMGLPPVRIDILKGVPGGDFDACFSRRIEARWDDTPVQVVSRADLMILKRASGRPQDLLDVEALARMGP